MSSEVVVSTRAYAKVLLHAARYPHASVCGLLLADGDELIDAAPLFHQALDLAPMYEVALTQIEAAATTVGQTLAGLYVANEHFTHETPDWCAPALLRVADKMVEHSPNTLLAVVNNSRLTLQLEKPAITLYRQREGVWQPLSPTNVRYEADGSDVVSELLQRGVQRELIDYDNHLDDLTLDWTNRALDKLVKTMRH